MPAATNHSRRSLWYLAPILAWAYAAGLIILFVSRGLWSPWPSFFMLLSYLGPFLFAPLVGLAALAAVTRSKAVWGAVAAAGALFLVLYLPFLLPRPAPPRVAGRTLSVLTFNLGADRAAPADLVGAIAGQDADIVAVQELVPATAEALRHGLSGRYPYQILNAGLSETGLLSRFPILGSARFHPADTGRTAIQARLEVDGTPVQVIVVHPEPPRPCWPPGPSLPAPLCYRALDRYVADIATRAAALPGPVLVLGDFNMSDQSTVYGRMAAVLGDAFREAGWGFGFTIPNAVQRRSLALPGPLVRIDYIFHSKEWLAEAAAVGCRGGSDHCFVQAWLRLRAPQSGLAR